MCVCHYLGMCTKQMGVRNQTQALWKNGMSLKTKTHTHTHKGVFDLTLFDLNPGTGFTGLWVAAWTLRTKCEEKLMSAPITTEPCRQAYLST